MRSLTLKNIKKTLSSLLCITILAGSFALTPFNRQAELQYTYALETVREVGPNLVANRSNAVVNTISQGLQDAFYVKEFTMDGILHGLAKMVLKSMTQSLLNWINSGFQGSPAFVTDLKQFMRERVDEVVGDYIYNDPNLNFLCSPFELDVKIALATSYQEQAHESGSQVQCTLSDVGSNLSSFLNGDSFDPATWFEVTQNPVNTPTGAFLEAQGEMYARIADEQGRTIQELEWGQGFLSFKVCSDTDVANGTQIDCDITTPGQVIAAQVNDALGAGQDALIEADEINEIISALFAQLANQAITGINGLLGLGGSNLGYTDNSFGDGTQSYLDALGFENTVSEGIENPLAAAVQREAEHIGLQTQIVNRINTIETYLNNAVEEYGQCITLTMPTTLINERDEAIGALITSEGVLPILEDLRDQFDTSTDAEEQLEIVTIYQQMQADDLVVALATNNLLQIHIDLELKESIADLRSRINQQIRACDDDD